MRGKHSNPIIHALAAFARERLRWRIADAVKWLPLASPEPGCTAIVGVSSRLPDVLAANMRCLSMSRWPDLKRVLLTVDCTRDAFPSQIEETIKRAYPELHIDFFFYSPAQSAMARKLELPFVYSWLSWSIALAEVHTRHVLFHDYDALVLGPTLAARHARFASSGAIVQGISWYQSNGIEQADHLATTFEAFFDTAWLRSFEPVALFNKLRLVRGRSIDMDTTLDIQHGYLDDSQRSIMPMDLAQLVHPSQMVHQYTMFRHSPGTALPCFSIPMIPFFAFLGGNHSLLDIAIERLEDGNRYDIDFLGDGTRFNFLQLGAAQVDWALKQMVQAFVALKMVPDPRIYRYGLGLYGIVESPAQEHWRGDFNAEQRAWINSASAASIDFVGSAAM